MIRVVFIVGFVAFGCYAPQLLGFVFMIGVVCIATLGALSVAFGGLPTNGK